MGPSDQDLIARVLVDDDRHAFATLVRRHQGSTRQFLLRLTKGDRSRADDLGQETFVRAYRHLGSYKGEARFSAWLCGIAYRLFLSDLRRQRARREELGEPGDAVQADTAALHGEHTHLRKDMERALTLLSDDERAALSMCFGQDLSHQEAAAALGWPLGTLKTHVMRGKDKLRKSLLDWQAHGAA